MVTIRFAEGGDSAVLPKIQIATLRERADGSYSEDELAAIAPDEPDLDGYNSLIQSESFQIVVAEDDRVLGFGTIHTGDCQIHGLYVRPDSTESGIGTTLLVRLEQLASNSGCSSVFALATLNAAPFYQKQGYERDGEETVGTEPKIPVIRVQKTLHNSE